MFNGDLAFESLSVWRALLDIGVVALLIYQLLLLLRGSRSGAVLLAVALMFGMFWVSQDDVLDLPTVNWLLDRFIGSIVVLLVVLFQDDIRRALASAIRTPLVFSSRDPESTAVLEEVLRSCAVLSQRGIGALIVIEQEAVLDRCVEGGIKMDASVSWQVLLSLFIPSHMNPTHDGAVVIQKGRIAAAACFLPLAYGDDLPPSMGSRHRAALGLADETDAIVVVVSEETGRCAVAHMGQLDVDLRPNDLRDRFRVLFDERRERGEQWQRHWRRRIVHHTARITGEHERGASHRSTGEHERHTQRTTEMLWNPHRTTGEQRRPQVTPEELAAAATVALVPKDDPQGDLEAFDPTATHIPEADPPKAASAPQSFLPKTASAPSETAAGEPAPASEPREVS